MESFAQEVLFLTQNGSNEILYICRLQTALLVHMQNVFNASTLHSLNTAQLLCPLFSSFSAPNFPLQLTSSLSENREMEGHGNLWESWIFSNHRSKSTIPIFQYSYMSALYINICDTNIFCVEYISEILVQAV